jgi:hypothetical protein
MQKIDLNSLPIIHQSYKLDCRPNLQDGLLIFNVDGKVKRIFQIVQDGNENIVLGSGGIGTVYLVKDITIRQDKTPLQYAVKVIVSEKAELIQESITYAREFVRDCPNTVEIYEDYFFTGVNFEKNSLYIVMVCIVHAD